MKKEKSTGTIIIKDNKVLLIKHVNGHWSFPKGHVENNETEQETALRETKEETNLDVELINNHRFVITYNPYPGVEKDVIFFLAKPLSNNIKPQLEEIEELGYYNFDEAIKMITYDKDKNIFIEALELYNCVRE